MKKIYWVLIIILIVLILAGVGYFFWARYTQSMIAKRQQNLIELPAGTDYSNLTNDQLKSFLDQTAAKYPNKTLKGKAGQIFAFIQGIILTQNNQPIPYNTTPPSPTPVDGDTVDPIDDDQDGDENDLVWPTFNFNWIIDINDRLSKTPFIETQKIKAKVEKYYPDLVEIYGLPYDVENRTIQFVYDKDADFYAFLPQSDQVILGSSERFAVLSGLLAAFQGPYFTLVPETWECGMMYSVIEMIMKKYPGDADQWDSFFLSSIDTVVGDYEKYNIKEFPIWGTNVNYENEILDTMGHREFLPVAAFSKPYQYDNQFFAKLNQQFYNISITSSYWQYDNVLFETVSPAFPAIEGLGAVEWYKTQHVLHQTLYGPGALGFLEYFGSTFVVKPSGTKAVYIYGFKTVGTNNGGKFVPFANSNVDIRIEDHRANRIKQQIYTYDASGKLTISGGDFSAISDSRYVFRSKFLLRYLKRANFGFFEPEEEPSYGLYGAVDKFGQGKIALFDSDGAELEEVAVENGTFKFQEPSQGIVKLKVKDYNDNVVLEEELAKDDGKYYAFLESESSSYPPSPPTGARGGAKGCDNIDTSDWKTYDPADAEWTIEYPSDWEYSTQDISPNEITPQWEVGFGQKDQGKVVWVGIGVTDPEPLKENLENMTPGFDIESEETITVDNEPATKYTVQGRAASYLSYIYAIPYFNLGYLLQGPAIEEPTLFENCEPQIFKLMVDTFDIPEMPENTMPSM